MKLLRPTYQWQDTHVETWKGGDTLVLNAGLYARHRSSIQDALARKARAAIDLFEI
ncbi:hypothetical protein RYA05_25485 [Pseudomonas syringae pv. actinidiae]|uniref:Uncharacterized protein n=1 Tax=Pseudomonas syringae pv. actinidiae TaxID=103796 RepID=A0AAN4Q0T7_PSESF|nr:hypothetical protein [Pseudomonas syringae]EPN86654.1 hypothetical protein A234_00635 [Pseudomonas syringae pv. actinidiae ICMP 19101]MDU8355167.1 hypothetical protein [Pseudomonas syringae pv. actinidiae]OSN15517.1 hypothetical protein BV340_03904 [Pseudomonas syringae pv. actinidiae]OSN21638.1 hypothetical protein BV339_01893 [Pseudomonas syringae pv. actinidiae]OSN24981.1 hypothetical protein BV341_03755 [Pseudomonas syringae pv. actinidiae]